MPPSYPANTIYVRCRVGVGCSATISGLGIHAATDHLLPRDDDDDGKEDPPHYCSLTESLVPLPHFADVEYEEEEMPSCCGCT